MFTVIGLMFCGILAGFLLRKRDLTKAVGRAITALIWVLLFLLGVEVGGNRRIIEGLATLGIEALVISLLAVLGSCVAAWALWALVYKKRRSGSEG